MKGRKSRFLTAVLSAMQILIMLPVIVSAESLGPPGIVHALNHGLHPQDAPFLRRAWQTFDDDELVPEPPPTGFVLESALGLAFPRSVVGVIAPPIIRDDTIYYVDELGTVFARDASSGLATDPTLNWATTLVDPDFDNNTPPCIAGTDLHLANCNPYARLGGRLRIRAIASHRSPRRKRV
jgi:hypothetical protein